MGRKVSKRVLLEEIYTLACESIGWPVALDFAAIETYRLQLTRNLELNQQRVQVDARSVQLPIYPGCTSLRPSFAGSTTSDCVGSTPVDFN